MEAANRFSFFYANISSGNIGEDARNDIAWRRDWVARLTETEQYFDTFNKTESMPYTLFYVSDKIKQEGGINYQNETVSLSIETHLHGSAIWTVSIERALRAVYDGLDATKRKDTWGLGSWPRQGVTNLNAFARRSGNFSVVFELLNDQNKVIGRQTLQSGGSWGLNWSGRPVVEVNADDRKTLNFQSVNVNDISDKMTIRIATVNGTVAETAARNGVLQMRAITRDEFYRNDHYKFSRGGTIQGFTNDAARDAEVITIPHEKWEVDNIKLVIIPDNIWGDPVTSIAKEAFYQDTGLTSVIIPNSVRSIGETAFRFNRSASITIGENVSMAKNTILVTYKASDGYTRVISDDFKYTFQNYYNNNGKKAGTYSLPFAIFTAWKYSPQ
jgi:hypothetical protein